MGLRVRHPPKGRLQFNVPPKSLGDFIEIQEFFETYKRLEPHKWVKVREWKDAQVARKIVEYSMEKYRELSEKPPTNHK